LEENLMRTSLDAALVADLAGEVSGSVLGPQDAGDLEPFKTWGSPLMVEVGPMPYPVMNTILDAGFPDGSLNYWLSSFTRGLPDELIDIAVERYATVPSPMTAILVEHFHGAVTRVGASETEVPHRDQGWNLLIPTVWTDAAHNDANVAWSRESFAAMRPHFATGRWLNYSVTIRRRTPSAQPTVRTTTGSERSSGGTTRTTSSTSTTTSPRSAGPGAHLR
jgi:hypothetical protein